MLAHKSARIRQLSGIVSSEEPPLSRIDLQPRFRLETVTKHDKALAESFLKREASAARGSQSLLRRVKSKLSRPDKAITLKALCNHVQQNGAAEVAQIYIDRLSIDAAESALPFDIPDDLLLTAVKNGNIDLVRLLAAFSAEEALSAALEVALYAGDPQIVTALVAYGSDPNNIDFRCILHVAEGALDLLRIVLAAPKRLAPETCGTLCVALIRHGRTSALIILLQRIPEYHVFGNSSLPWNRDNFLATSLASPNKGIFFHIALATSHWQLLDYRLFLQVLNAPGIDHCLGKDILEVLLCLCDPTSTIFQESSELQFALGWCIQQQQEDVLRLLIAYGVRISAEPLLLACQTHNVRCLDILLSGNIYGADEVAARMLQLQGASQQPLRHKVLARLLASGAGGAWIHDELITAVAKSQIHWVDALLQARASVDYRGGAALLSAVSTGHVRIIRSLLSCPVSLETLQAAFPRICLLEALPRRLLTRLFLDHGLRGQCLDECLNTEICNYSHHRDPELMDMLIKAGGVCSITSLTVAWEHQEVDVFDKICQSPTVLHNAAFLWLRDWHQILLGHVVERNALAAASSACLKMLFTKLNYSTDLCSTHDGQPELECLHKFLQHGACDGELLSAWLVWMQHADSLVRLEIVLTAACFCDMDELQLIVRSLPSTHPTSPASSSSRRSSAPAASLEARANQFSSARIPPLRDDWDFSDEQSNDALKVVFRQYLKSSSENQLAIKLLRRHLEQCQETTLPGEDWPVLTTQYLLSQPIDVTMPEYTSCLRMTIAAQQWLVLESLLDRQLPRDMLSSFFLVETSSLTSAALGVLLDSQALSCVDDDFFSDVVQKAFNHACLSQEHELAILLCTKSRCKLRISGILNALRLAVDAYEVGYISIILGETSFSTEDLDQLWAHVSQQSTRSDFLVILEVLLKAGANGPSVELTLLDAIERNEEGLVTFILRHLQPPTSPACVDDFDYRQRRLLVRPANRTLCEGPLFAHALHVAVRLNRANLCQILCAAGAALVYQKQSVFQVAVVLGSLDALAELIRSTTTRSNMEQVVDFALLQAVIHNRPSWIYSLVEMGGSINAYQCESLKEAAARPQPDMLKALLSYERSPKALAAVHTVLALRLSEPNLDIDNITSMFEQLREAGFEDPQAFSDALLAISGLSTTKLQNLSTIIRCGASVEANNGGCMMQCWKRGNASLFPYLLSHCTRDSIVAVIWDEACQDYLRQDLTQGHNPMTNDKAVLIFKSLLERSIPQALLDAALDDIARSCQQDLQHSAVIKLLLDNGARFLDGAGLPLYHVCRFGDAEVAGLVAKSQLSLRTRFSAAQHLFRNQNTHTTLEPLNSSVVDNACDQMCLYRLNFPATEDDCTELEASDIISLLSAMLCPKGDRVGTNLMFSFFFMLGGLRLLTPRVCPEDDRNELEQLFTAIIMSCEGDAMDRRLEFLVDVLQIEALNTEGVWSDTAGFALNEDSLARLLLLCMQYKKLALVNTLLAAGARADAVNDEGRTALYLATSVNDLETMELLIQHGALPNDGSLQIATSRQYHEAMHSLLQAGHSPTSRTQDQLGETPLEAFLRHNHPENAEDMFGVTLTVLLCDAELPADFWTRDPSPLALALAGSSPFEMFSALLDLSPAASDDIPLVSHDRFKSSILSFVEKGEDIPISEEQRIELADRLELLEFTRTHYAVEGAQPDDAVNVPEEFEAPEIRARRRAFREKDCAVCGDKPEDRDDIHAALSPACEAHHGWEDDIICTECLQGHLGSQMFPQDDDRFPSATVKCWAPNCGEVLPHSAIHEHALPERFAVYDAALAQLCLNDGANTAKCASPRCSGATWLDAEEDKDVTIITCPVCSLDTCIQCNQLYDKHRDEPCPQGEEARGVERRREEEAATAALLAKGKKCPRCQQQYERIEGCDHIVCGKDAHSHGRGRKFFSTYFFLCCNLFLSG
jgi:ankyrin repeat protein